MKDFQLRVIQERDELKTKVDKLKEFIEGSVYRTLDNSNQHYLMSQYFHMSCYLDILEKRIALFKED